MKILIFILSIFLKMQVAHSFGALSLPIPLTENQVSTSLLTANDLRKIRSAGSAVEGQFSAYIPPGSWTSSITMLAMHDALNATTPKYRTYGHFSYLTKNSSVYVGESAAILIYKKFQDLMIQRYQDKLDENKKKQLDLAYTNLHSLITSYLSKYSSEVLLESEGIASEIFDTYMNFFRKNDMGSQTAWPDSVVPGVYRAEPGAVYDGAIVLLGAKTFGVCDTPDLYQGLKATTPEFTPSYLNELEEVRCLGRIDDPNGQTVVGPGCQTSLTQSQREDMVLGGWSPFSVVSKIKERLEVTRQLSFADVVRFDALRSVTAFDTDVLVWGFRSKVLHWRPMSAIRSGFNSPLIETVIEKDWRSRDGTILGFPEYPSGSHASIKNRLVMATYLLNENPLHQNKGGDISTIDGEPFELILSDKYVMNGETITVSRAVNHFDEILKIQGDSRIYYGAHFRFSVIDGGLFGERITTNAWNSGILAPIGSARDRFVSHLDEKGQIRNCKMQN